MRDQPDTRFAGLGLVIAQMIAELKQAAGTDVGFSRRKITYPGGEVYLILANTEEVAECMESAAAAKYDVVDVPTAKKVVH